jgi:hypothetical protein
MLNRMIKNSTMIKAKTKMVNKKIPGLIGVKQKTHY